MKRVLTFLVATLLCALSYSAFTAHGQAVPQKVKGKFRKVEGRSIPDQYVVVLKDGVAASGVEPLADELARAHGGRRGFVYETALRGFSVRLPEAAARALSNDPRVDYVIEDGEVSVSATQLNPPSWGLDRIDQRDLPLNQQYNYDFTGAGVHAYVIDSGIRPTHVDFGGRASIAADFVGDGQGGNDCHGHGTHVAGTLGGTSYGVAKGVSLHAVRVLNCSGNGTTSGVIAGVDWVTANRINPAVANMSLGGPAYDALDTAVRNSIASGVTYTIAAGNSGVDASQTSPARVTQALTVGATDISDVRANFSNYGSVLDLFAPGVAITSAWPDGIPPPFGSDCVVISTTPNAGAMRCSGTSQATPHVAGVAALYLQNNPGATPATVGSAITSNASTGKVINPGANSPNRLLYSPWNLAVGKVATQSSTLETADYNTVRNQPGVSSYFTAGPAGQTTNIAVNRTGRYVRVQLTEFDYLSLAEVQVLSGSTNLALGRPATQYNTGFGGDATRAVDGNTDGNWANNSVTHTYGDYQNWWQVDLGSVQSISNIQVWNRTDCCSERLRNFYVFVSDVPFQGSTADKAVDGNTDGFFWNGSVSHTNNEVQPWWQVDLNSSRQINTIQIWNRTDCCGELLSDFYLLVSDAPFQSTDLTTTINQPGVSSYYTPGQAGRPTTLTINRTGRYIRVQRVGTSWLSVAEVQVW